MPALRHCTGGGPATDLPWTEMATASPANSEANSRIAKQPRSRRPTGSCPSSPSLITHHGRK